jgi:rRNA maturation RNase YbeY
VDDLQIKELNKKYLRRNRPTDVISFSQIEGNAHPIVHTTCLLGDVVISLETAKRQARQLSLSLKEELMFLLIHGILHLLGHDHEGSEKKAKEMHAQEQRLVSKLKAVRLLTR